MRNLMFLATIPLLLTTVGCIRKPCRDDVVCATYVHPYGLEISCDEWNRQGSSGDVIVTNKEGVTIKKVFQKGVLDGEVTYSFPFRDSVETVEIYDHGRLTKEARYYSSGVVKSELEYPAEGEHILKTFYDQGAPKSEEHFVGDKLMTGTYFNSNHLVESRVENYFGKRTLRDIYGQLISVDTIEDGVMAASTTYHPNGMPEATTPYVNGVVHGQKKTFLPGGEPYSVELWEEGVQNGITIFYEDGEKIAEVPYYQGRRNGIEKRFRNNAQVVEEIGWLNDSRHGPTRRYVEGKVVIDYYFHGTPVTKGVFDKRSAMMQPQVH